MISTVADKRAWIRKHEAGLIVFVPMLLGLILASFTWYAPVNAAGPSDTDAIVRSLDRIAARLDQINDSLKGCQR